MIVGPNTVRVLSGADSVLPSIAGWEKTLIEFPTSSWRSSHEAHHRCTGFSRVSRSERRGLLQVLDHRYQMVLMRERRCTAHES